MNVPGCNRGYSDSLIAVHLHDYAGKVWIGGTCFHLQPGDMTLSPENRESVYELRESGQHLCVHFYPARGAGKKTNLRLPIHFRPGPLVAAARERFLKVIDYYRQAGGAEDSPAAAAASASLQELLLWLHLQGSRGTRARPGIWHEKTLADLRRAIDATPHRQVTVPGLSASMGRSANALSRLFRQQYGMTILHYLLLRRMELARHLLLSTRLPILEIGRKVGIPDPQYFNKQFRRVTGQSPSMYRLRPRREAGGTLKSRSALAKRKVNR